MHNNMQVRWFMLSPGNLAAAGFEKRVPGHLVNETSLCHASVRLYSVNQQYYF